MNEIEVFGYSEREIFNSIIFYLKDHPEEISYFLNVLGIKDDNFFNINCKYKFLNEQSYSQFGSNDLTIIAENNKDKRVIYIEGKVKTYQKNNFTLESNFEKLKNSEKFKGLSSNIFVQLYFKYLLSKYINIQNDLESINIPEVFKINSRSGLLDRQLGENKIVLKAVDLIKNASEYYYVAILPIQNNEIIKKFEELNNTIFKYQPMELKNVQQTYWGQLEKHYQNIPTIKKNFEFNYDLINKIGQIY